MPVKRSGNLGGFTSFTVATKEGSATNDAFVPVDSTLRFMPNVEELLVPVSLKSGAKDGDSFSVSLGGFDSNVSVQQASATITFNKDKEIAAVGADSKKYNTKHTYRYGSERRYEFVDLSSMKRDICFGSTSKFNYGMYDGNKYKMDRSFKGLGEEAFTVRTAETINFAGVKSVFVPYVVRNGYGSDMGGVDAAKKIRKRYDNETTVIIMTYVDLDEITDAERNCGADSFLAKPFFASNVIDEFERIARKNQMSVCKEKKRANLEGRHILMAEDMFINAEIIKELLTLRGCVIEHAKNGKEAFDLFARSEKGEYDAILMDIRMPEMDGLSATAAIRILDHPDAQTIPIIAMTANAFDEDVQRSLQVGMNAHLSKPVEPEHLYVTLEELIWEAEHHKTKPDGDDIT